MQTPDLTLSESWDKALLVKIDILLIDLGLFRRSNELRMFCQKFGEQTLSGLHQSFANADKFSTIITKQRALEYPCGRHVAGIYYKLEHDSSFKVSRSLIY